ncbi:hypothetical protein T492DRAFT_933120 [Pavlovales sp. CCMP2436]|nr:hypothetical protein T492DRAFT_933120 [Pavlovales sp. CCMP2436]|mmetsp:Transcript_24853/g.62926  ORF Transcript_24853/g.62926 Transcript_24853/m.62926 type:complete len:327 (+) Transcript_24853:51-1031(+)
MEARKEELRRLMVAKQAELEQLRASQVTKEQARASAETAQPPRTVLAAQAPPAAAGPPRKLGDMPPLTPVYVPPKRKLGDCPPLSAVHTPAFARAPPQLPALVGAAMYSQMLGKVALVDRAGDFGGAAAVDPAAAQEKRQRLAGRLGSSTAAGHAAEPARAAASLARASAQGKGQLEKPPAASAAAQHKGANPPGARASAQGADAAGAQAAALSAFRVRTLEEIIAAKHLKKAAASADASSPSRQQPAQPAKPQTPAKASAAKASTAPATSAAKKQPQKPATPAQPAPALEEDDDLLAGVEAGDVVEYNAEDFDKEMLDMESMLAT